MSKEMDLEFEVELKSELYTIIGILAKEREIPQKIVLELFFTYKGEFVDYAKVFDLLQKHINQKKFFLIEDALQSSLNLLFQTFPSIQKAKLSITKPQILPNALPKISLSLKRN